jgi:hypothetical protein
LKKKGTLYESKFGKRMQLEVQIAKTKLI